VSAVRGLLERGQLVPAVDHPLRRAQRLACLLLLARDVRPELLARQDLDGRTQRATIEGDEAEAQGPRDEVVTAPEAVDERRRRDEVQVELLRQITRPEPRSDDEVVDVADRGPRRPRRRPR